MYQKQRVKAIIELLRKKEQLSTQEIMSEFDISRDTARRDIIEVVETGHAIRTHGGLISTHQKFPVLDFYDRQNELNSEKKEIAHKATKLIEADGLYFLDVSTIITMMANKINKPCQIYTHALDNATVLSMNNQIRLNLLGGTFDYKNRFFYPEIIDDVFSDVKFDTVFIGAASLEDDGLYFKEKENAAIKRQVIKRARKVVLVAENKKFFKNSRFRGAKYSDIDVFITDQPLTKAQRALFSENVEIIY